MHTIQHRLAGSHPRTAGCYTGQTVSVGGGFPLQRRQEMEDALGLTELRQTQR